MISTKLSVFSYIAVVFYFICIFYLIKRKSLSLKYSLMWLFSGIVIFLIILYPKSFSLLMYKIGVVNASNGLFAICIFLFLIMMLILTAIISKMNAKIKTMIQELGLLEKRIRELENEGNMDL